MRKKAGIIIIYTFLGFSLMELRAMQGMLL